MKEDLFPKEISQYVDLKSPILKYLIEIERKFWKSETNQHFALPRKSAVEPADDSESSIQSLRGVTAYQLNNQNGPAKQAQHVKTVAVKRTDKLKLTLNSLLQRETVAGFKSQPRNQRVDAPIQVVDMKQLAKKRGKKFDLVEEGLLNISKPIVTPQGGQAAHVYSFKTSKTLRHATSGDFKAEKHSSAMWTAIKEPSAFLMGTQVKNLQGLKSQNFFKPQEKQVQAKYHTVTQSPRHMMETVLEATPSMTRIRIASNLQSTSILKHSGYIGPSSPRAPALAKLNVSGDQSYKPRTYKFDSSFGLRGDLKKTMTSGKKIGGRTSNLTLANLSSQMVTGSKLRLDSRKDRLKSKLMELSVGSIGGNNGKSGLQLVGLRDKNLVMIKNQGLGSGVGAKSPETSYSKSSQLFNTIRNKLAR